MAGRALGAASTPRAAVRLCGASDAARSADAWRAAAAGTVADGRPGLLAVVAAHDDGADAAGFSGRPPATPDLHAWHCPRHGDVLWSAGAAPASLRRLVLRATALEWIAGAHDGRPLARALARLAAPGATLRCAGAAPALQAALRSAGFGGQPAPGGAWHGRFTPSWPAASGAGPAESDPPDRHPAPADERRALVVGAGLAGAWVARALADRGWDVTVVDAAGAPAAGASGNPAGLFHGTVHPDDGPHARLLRVAALEAARAVRAACAAGVAGAASGLLRRVAPDEAFGRPAPIAPAAPPASPASPASSALPALQALAARQGLPARWVQPLGAADASARAGLPLSGAAWCYPEGGWVDPGALVRHVLGDLPLITGAAVARLARGGPDADRRDRWALLDAAGRTLASAPVVVLACAGGVPGLLRSAGLAVDWPLGRQRGQVCVGRAAPALRGLRLPLAGGGYVLPLGDGRVVFGATADRDPLEPQPGEATAPTAEAHRRNLQRLRRVTELDWPLVETEAADADAEGAVHALEGRVGWRLLTADRLPVLGAVPALALAPGGAAQGRRGRRGSAADVPREPGLFVCTALGGRGITLAPLLGRALAALIDDAPLPLEAALMQAMDPARWALRAARRGRTGWEGTAAGSAGAAPPASEG